MIDWPIINELPPGWVIDRTCGSPLHGHVFIHNGKSPINGQQRALMPVKIQPAQPQAPVPPAPAATPQDKQRHIADLRLDTKNSDPAYPKAVNDLARAQFKQKMLADVRVDLAICELEGWSKREYIDELIGLLRSLLVNRHPKQLEMLT